jgi:Ca2+-binding EF-hand superfamily protein
VFPEDQATSVSPKASAENGSAGDQPSVSEDATASGKIDPSSSLTPRAGAQGKPFPKRPMGCKLSQNIRDKLEELFRKMDPDGSNAVSKEEARLFFKGAFGKVSADAMFNEVDVDGSGAIDADEFVSFWIHVRKSGYKEQDILDELDELLEGGAWVDWKDGKDTGAAAGVQFPKRPMLCRLGANTWEKCRELFMKIDPEGKCITQEKAAKHFVKGFGKVSVDAMFNEIDMNHHGQITPKEWMKFWVQVKSNGYKDQDILDELDNLMEGQQWVDWKDGRSTA